MSARRLLGRGGSALLVILVLAMVVAAVGVLLGWRALITESHTMEPRIDAGSVLLTRPIKGTDVRVGDVVSLRLGDDGRRTRRVVKVRRVGGGEVSLTVADEAANRDPRSYDRTDVDKVFLDIPVLGRVIDAIISLPGLLVVFILALLLNMRRRSRS